MGYITRLIDVSQQVAYMSLLSVTYPAHLKDFLNRFKVTRLQYFSPLFHFGLTNQESPIHFLEKGNFISIVLIFRNDIELFEKCIEPHYYLLHICGSFHNYQAYFRQRSRNWKNHACYWMDSIFQYLLNHLL
jgi:hypothetical protein